MYASAEDKLAKDLETIKSDPNFLLIAPEKDIAVRSRTTNTKSLLQMYNLGIEAGERVLKDLKIAQCKLWYNCTMLETRPTFIKETSPRDPDIEFRKKQFQKMADRHNKRGSLLSRREGTRIFSLTGRVDSLVDKKALNNDKPNRPKHITAEYVEQEYVARKSADIERRKDPEFREWQMVLKPVIDAFKAKRDDPEGEGEKHKVVVLILGGGMRGPYSAGQVIGLNEMGLTADKADAVVGISAGAGTGSYYMTGHEGTRRGASIFYDECDTPAFLDVSRATHMLDATIVGDAMRGEEKYLDQKAIRDSKTEFYSVVSRRESQEAELIDVKNAKPDMVAPIEASMNVPLLRAPGIKVNENSLSIEYIDGGFDPLPLQQLIDKFKPTDGRDLSFLVLPNAPFARIETFSESTGPAKYLPRAGSPGTLKKFYQVTRDLRRLLESFKKEQNVNIGILWPPDRGLHTLDTDAGMIELAENDAARDTIKQFGEKQPERIKMYTPKKFRQPEIVLAKAG